MIVMEKTHKRTCAVRNKWEGEESRNMSGVTGKFVRLFTFLHYYGLQILNTIALTVC